MLLYTSKRKLPTSTMEDTHLKPITHIYHMAEVTNWPFIQRHGLHSTSSLLDLAGITGPDRTQLEHNQRLTHIILPNGIEIRDQRPMPPSALTRCLIDITPNEWYALLNAHIFFWPDPARLQRHRAACNTRPQIILTIDAPRLIAAYADRVTLTPINTGNARRHPAKRGPATFVPYHQWLTSGWTSEAAALGTPPRPRSHPPAELTITGSIPDILHFITNIQELAPSQPFIPPNI